MIANDCELRRSVVINQMCRYIDQRMSEENLAQWHLMNIMIFIYTLHC